METIAIDTRPGDTVHLEHQGHCVLVRSGVTDIFSYYNCIWIVQVLPLFKIILFWLFAAIALVPYCLYFLHAVCYCIPRCLRGPNYILISQCIFTSISMFMQWETFGLNLWWSLQSPLSSTCNLELCKQYKINLTGHKKHSISLVLCLRIT